MKINATKQIASILSLLTICSCSPIVSLRSYRNQKLGEPIESVRQMNASEYSYATSINWKEKTYTLDNGNSVYVDPYAPNCSVHWEVNPQGTIVGSSVEGTGCDMWPFR